ncbi:MAG: hypothetical protein HFF84_07720 [Oscillibacter sp.]|nr:hypothetical protein [Oscillibacter sp.]
MEKLMSDIILTAKNFSENFKECGDFDFSIESLGAVETLLDELSGYSLNEAGLQDASSMIGSYVFEVARRNYGGEYFWIEEEEQPLLTAGIPDFRISIKAWEKVRGRLTKGKEDNIPYYLEGFRQYIEKGKQEKGYAALIV